MPIDCTPEYCTLLEATIIYDIAELSLLASEKSTVEMDLSFSYMERYRCNCDAMMRAASPSDNWTYDFDLIPDVTPEMIRDARVEESKLREVRDGALKALKKIKSDQKPAK